MNLIPLWITDNGFRILSALNMGLETNDSGFEKIRNETKELETLDFETLEVTKEDFNEIQQGVLSIESYQYLLWVIEPNFDAQRTRFSFI